MIASDVRQKLRGLCKSLTFNERLIDTYFNGQSQSQLASQHFQSTLQSQQEFKPFQTKEPSLSKTTEKELMKRIEMLAR